MKWNADWRWYGCTHTHHLRLLIVDWKISKISNRRTWRNKVSHFLQSTISNQSERGQAIAHFAILIPVTILFFLGVVDYMVSNARAMDTVAAAALAAHAGAQSIILLPDGTIDSDVSLAQQVAAAYFAAQAPPEATLGSVACGLVQNRPACQVSAAVQSAGWLLPPQWISIQAVGYLAYGVTEDDQ